MTIDWPAETGDSSGYSYSNSWNPAGMSHGSVSNGAGKSIYFDPIEALHIKFGSGNDNFQSSGTVAVKLEMGAGDDTVHSGIGDDSIDGGLGE
ncbi:MAG TPA: hypothetical protein VNT25_06275, partial [Allosphingosinicella sp.]|nr:hypothetical protein [Allosphingosinicella sp.]